MAVSRISGLASFVKYLKLFCKYKDAFKTPIRNALPTQYRATFDDLDTAVTAMCEIVNSIDFIGDGVGTN